MAGLQGHPCTTSTNSFEFEDKAVLETEFSKLPPPPKELLQPSESDHQDLFKKDKTSLISEMAESGGMRPSQIRPGKTKQTPTVKRMKAALRNLD